MATRRLFQRMGVLVVLTLMVPLLAQTGSRLFEKGLLKEKGEGDLQGAEQVILRPSARVRGNIAAPRVILEDGARFQGSIDMDVEADARPAPPARPLPARPEPKKEEKEKPAEKEPSAAKAQDNTPAPAG